MMHKEEGETRLWPHVDYYTYLYSGNKVLFSAYIIMTVRVPHVRTPHKHESIYKQRYSTQLFHVSVILKKKSNVKELYRNVMELADFKIKAWFDVMF